MLSRVVESGFSVEKAHKTQLQMSRKIVFEDRLPSNIRFIGGVDVAYTENMSIGAIAVLEYNSLKLVDSQVASCETRFPYIPTLLSFREVLPAVLASKKLDVQPDVFLVDGQGFAHPYGCGFASHLGLVLGEPTIGVAKSKLLGVLKKNTFNDVSFLEYNGKTVGAAVTTKRGCKPVYVSVGHMVSLETAIKIVKHCAPFRRIPEPIVKAHEIATSEKRKIHISSTLKEKP